MQHEHRRGQPVWAELVRARAVGYRLGRPLGQDGKIEEAATQEAWWRWQADQIDDDSRVTALMLETEGTVEG